MSTEAKLFAAYFGVGLVVIVVAFISGRAKRGAKLADPLVDAGPIAAGILIIISLLWPVWLLWLLFGKDGSSSKR